MSVAAPPAPPSGAEPIFLTREEVASLLRVKPYQVDRLRRAGRLPYRRTGGSENFPRGFRFLRSDVEAYAHSLPAESRGGEA